MVVVVYSAFSYSPHKLITSLKLFRVFDMVSIIVAVKIIPYVPISPAQIRESSTVIVMINTMTVFVFNPNFSYTLPPLAFSVIYVWISNV